MKKSILLSVIFLFLLGTFVQNSAYAAPAGSRRANITQAQIQEMSSTLDNFNLKIHTKSLFSPEENEELFNIKLKLDTQMQKKPEASLAPLYYKAGLIFASREYKKESLDCYQTVIENFGSTVYAQKARKELAR